MCVSHLNVADQILNKWHLNFSRFLNKTKQNTKCIPKHDSLANRMFSLLFFLVFLLFSQTFDCVQSEFAKEYGEKE